jgi:GR25 family glycosyltransferase involved in LPS biosynthesis
MQPLNLFYSYDIDVEAAYIITIKGNEVSEKFSERAANSCKNVSMPYRIWHAVDGTGDTIRIPENLTRDTILNIVKVTDHYLTKGELACALSHISLWSHCAQIDKPIVILEHDAVMIKKFEQHQSFNSIVYLGGVEWAKQGWKILPIPPHASEGPNYHFICRAHAYSIDPTMAKNLLAHVIKMGIHAPLDIMLRADLFNITHQGMYSYDDTVNRNNDTTIKARPIDGRTTKRNDNLIV